ncbi:actinodefensin-associated protein B [Saccharothrix algeriensis]|uniref:Mycofactocin biosynthesis chaperone MftB n=1 Tax=Saccharothrix algeriensis TaxID=173560 RepID=A0ABS2SEK1_9PSEU|nr:actinodefensin-associated protein B [Saccharothrix algeriensis]MBM7814696.1 hypothetical protein [Saccharothrix algeriensis]
MTALRIAPHVTVTQLPYGGAVLVDGVTLAVAECEDREAEFLDLLLSRGALPEGASPATRRFAEQLVGAGWFLAVDDERSS